MAEEWGSLHAIRAVDLDGTEKKIVITNIYINSHNGSTVIDQISSKEVNNPYRLGGGILYQTRVFKTDPYTGVSEIEDIPYYKEEEVGLVQGLINSLFNWGKKVWNSGFVVFGKCKTGDCISGSGGEYGRVLGVIDLNDEDTKDIIELITLIPTSTPPVGQGEILENIVDNVNEISKYIIEKRTESETSTESSSSTTSNSNISDTVNAPAVILGRDPETGKPNHYKSSSAKEYIKAKNSKDPDTIRVKQFSTPK